MAQPYVIEDEPSPHDVRVLEDGLYRYNVQQTGRGTDAGSRSSSATLTRPSWRA
jgi:hypothetical protein